MPTDIQEPADELARAAVRVVAPEESPVFDETAQEYHAHPRVARGLERTEELGFGLDLAMVTPVALAVAGAVVHYLVSAFADRAAEETTRAVLAKIRRRPEAPPLAPEHLGEIRRISIEHSTQLGLDSERAALLADAIVGALTDVEE